MAKRIIEYKVKKPFEGVIKLHMPKYKDRIELIKGLNIKGGSENEMELSDDKLDAATKMVDIAETHVEEVDVTHIESQTKFTSLDDLDAYAEGSTLIQELAGIVINGVRLGKDSGESSNSK